MNNITELEPVRKIKKIKRQIKSIEQSIKEYTELRNLKQNYLNTLQKYKFIITINKECHQIHSDIIEFEATLGMMLGHLERLKKELKDE